MGNLNLLKNGLGFGLKGFGFFWGVFDRFLCRWICIGNSCSEATPGTCTKLFLFVAIIFIICGYAVITLPKRKREKVKKIVEPDISEDE